MNPSQHGRLVEVARAVDRAATGERLRAPLDSVTDQLGDLVALLAVDEWTEFYAGLGSTADLHAAQPAREPIGELLGH